jgi:hypothetical protein
MTLLDPRPASSWLQPLHSVFHHGGAGCRPESARAGLARPRDRPTDPSLADAAAPADATEKSGLPRRSTFGTGTEHPGSADVVLHTGWNAKGDV